METERISGESPVSLREALSSSPFLSRYLDHHGPTEPKGLPMCPSCGGNRAKYVLVGGVPPLSEVWKCPECDIDPQAVEMARRGRHFATVCPRSYQDTRPDLLPDPAAFHAISAKLREESVKIGAGLIGLPGYGKTRMMWEVLRGVVLETGQRITAYDAIGFASACSASALEGGASVNALVDHLSNVDILALDDLGKERLTPARGEIYFAIIERRTANKKALFFTSNYDGKGLVSRWGGDDPTTATAIVRRLREFCHVVKVSMTE